MVKLLICIPSIGRPYDFAKKMMPWVEETGIDWKVFVEPHEYIYYKQVCGIKNVIRLPKDEMKLGYCCNYYSKYAMDNGYGLLWRIDDDTNQFTSKWVGNGKGGHTKQVIEYMLKEVLPDFEKYDKLGAVRFLHARYSIYEAIGKNRKYTHVDDELFNSRIVRPKIENLLDEKITTGEDACLSVLLKDAGYYILTYGRVGINSAVNKNAGGFNMMDRAGMTKETHKYITERFPKIELRKNNTWFGLDLNVFAYLNKKSLPINAKLEDYLL